MKSGSVRPAAQGCIDLSVVKLHCGSCRKKNEKGMVKTVHCESDSMMGEHC